jgi:ATPase subunit of ABC transporter with duplicated ATPase domains
MLMLDEPTNDLDLQTLRVLEDALCAFAGCAIVVSHDRWFLDRVATHILAFESEGQARWFEGDYQMYAERRAEELAAAGESRKGPRRRLRI